jgi:hypothetical protein
VIVPGGVYGGFILFLIGYWTRSDYKWKKQEYEREQSRRQCGSRKCKNGEGKSRRQMPDSGASLFLSANCEQVNQRFCQNMALHLVYAHVGVVSQTLIRESRRLFE